jgi:hypothetical protein
MCIINTRQVDRINTITANEGSTVMEAQCVNCAEEHLASAGIYIHPVPRLVCVGGHILALRFTSPCRPDVDVMRLLFRYKQRS